MGPVFLYFKTFQNLGIGLGLLSLRD